MDNKIRVIVPTIYKIDCPTICSRLLPWATVLSKKGFEFTFLVLKDNSPQQQADHGITYRYYKNYFELLSMILSLKRANFDIILACKPYSITGMFSYFIAKIKGLGFILDVDDRIFPSEINKWWRLPLYLQEWCVEHFLIWLKPLTLVASKELFKYWGKHSHYLPNSVDTKKFSRSSKHEDIVKKRFGINGPVVIWPAVFFQEIDKHYVLEIFKHIQAKEKNIFLLILGEGEYLSVIRKRIKEKGLHNVLFGGAVEHALMPSYYESATIGIMPLRNNHYDSCKGPIKLYEYMAMELPVASTPIGEPLETINGAKCGVFFPFEDSEAAADVIIKLCESDEDLQKMGKNGRGYLEKCQSIEMNAGRLERLLRGISGTYNK